MNLVDQIFEQAKAGSAQGQSIQGFSQGVEAGQNQQRINLASRQLAMELAQAPLKQTMLQQETQANALKLESALKQRDAMVTGYGQMADLANQVNQHFQTGNPEKADIAWFDTLSKNPRLINEPGFQQMRQAIDTSLQAKTKLMELKFAQPAIVPVTNPITGETVPLLRKSAGQYEPLKDTEATTAVKNTDALTKAQDALNTALKGDDEGKIARARNYLETLQGQALPTNETTTINPQTGEVTITRGPQKAAPGSLTTANTTRVQQELASNLQTIDTANRLEPLIDTETVGAQAFAESWVKDRILAQRFPEMASTKRATAENLASQLRASAVRELRSDGNISDKERVQILQAVPEINNPVDSPARAKQLITATRRMSAIHAFVAASKLGAPIPPQAAQALSAEELIGLARSGVISKDQAKEAYDLRNGAK